MTKAFLLDSWRLPLSGWAIAFILCFVAWGGAQSSEWPTKGGDVGDEVHVTTLAETGPGSLKAALDLKRARRIVFDVAGKIRLTNRMRILQPHVTIAGETAPDPGITLTGDMLQVRASNVKIRHIRVRVGDDPAGSGPGARDGIGIEPGPDGKPIENIAIVNCSVSWAIDENVGISGVGVSNVLIRNSIISEGLRKSIHPKGEHSMGMLVGREAKNVVVEKNLFADNVHRNPVIDGGASAIVVNNLIYNPGYTGFHLYAKEAAGPNRVSVVGNLLIAGPNTSTSLPSFRHGINPGSKVYYRGNRSVGTEAFSLGDRIGREGNRPVSFVDKPPIWFEWLSPEPVDRLEDTLLSNVGARPWARDKTDSRIIDEVRNRSGSIRNSPPEPIPQSR